MKINIKPRKKQQAEERTRECWLAGWVWCETTLEGGEITTNQSSMRKIQLTKKNKAEKVFGGEHTLVGMFK